MLITWYKIGEVHSLLLSTNGFHAKARNERFTAASSRCRQNFKYFTSSFVKTHCTKTRSASAAQLSFLQPMKSLTYGVVVDVAVVKS